jgi:hypothetical protein
MKVLGHELPPLLERELQGGRPTLGPDRLAALKPLLTRVEGVQPKLYSLAYIIKTNQLWESEDAKPYLRTPSTAHPPGDIDPRRAVIIGEAEPDSPIALDYRTTPPRVIYLGDIEHETHWLELASRFERRVIRHRPAPPNRQASAPSQGHRIART